MLPYINTPFIQAGRMLGTGPDELKLVFSFILSYPLAAFLKRIPDATPERKNAFIISVAAFYLVGLFDLWDGLRTVLISAGGAYGIAKFLRGSPYMPWAGFIFLMGHLSINHIVRQAINDDSVVDITGAQMVLVMKLSAFCWNVADGVLPEDQLSDFQRDRRLTELPGLLDYAGYVSFFPSLLIGPAFDFAEYRRWLDTTMFEVPSNVDPTKRPLTRRKRKIPRSGTPAMWKLFGGLTWVLLFVKLSGLFNTGLLTGPDYMQYSFPRRVFILHMVGLTARFKYYGVWTMTEGSCILAGLGYNGVDPITGKVSWNRLQNISPWGVETAQNSRAYLENWNMNTNKWLRNYIYLRVTPRGRKPGFRASLATFATSAFWHGFYPGYYLTFALGSLIQTAAKNFRRHLRPFFLDPATQAPLPSKRYYDVASFLATQLAFSFAVAPFLILSLGGSLLVWSRVYFYAVLGVAASLAFFASPAKPRLRRMLEQRTARATAAGGGGGGDADDAGGPLHRSGSAESVRGTALGVPTDPGRDLDEAIDELREGLQARRRSMTVEKKTE